MVRIHQHEAEITSLGKRALKGEPRATKEFLKQCEIAGMLTPQQLEQTHGVFGYREALIRASLKSCSRPMACRLGSKAEYAAVVAELERDQAHIEELYRKFLEDLRQWMTT